MTACTNKARGAVVAALAGVLALGAVPAVALATGSDVSLQWVTPEGAFSNAKLVSADFSHLGSSKDVTPTADGYTTEYDRNKPVVLDRFTVEMIGGAEAGKTLTIPSNDSNYTVEYFARDAETGKETGEAIEHEVVDAGEYVVKVTAVAGNYEGGVVYIPFDITAIDISDIKVGGETAGMYDAEAKDVFFYLDEDGGTADEYDEGVDTKLFENTDYTVQWYVTGHDTSDDYKVDSVLNAGDYRAQIKGTGNYEGSVDLNEGVVSVDELDLDDASRVYIPWIWSADASEPKAPEYIFIDGERFGEGDKIMGELQAQLDTEDSVDNMWVKNGTYEYVVSRKSADNANILADTTSITAYKFAEEVEWTYEGGELADHQEYFISDPDQKVFDDNKIVAVDSKDNEYTTAGTTPQDMIGKVIIDSEGNNVTNPDATGKNWWETPGHYSAFYFVSNGTSAGGMKLVDVDVYEQAINADAKAAVLYDVDGDEDGYKPEVVTSIEATYDGFNLLRNVTVVVEDADGNDLIEGTDYKVSYYDAEGNQVREIVNAGTYTLKLTSDTYKLSGTTEMTITVNKLDLSNVKADAVRKWFWDKVGNVTEYLPWEADGVTLDELELQYQNADGTWDYLPMDMVRATILDSEGNELNVIEDEGVYTIHFEARYADAENNYVVPADITVTCIKNGKVPDKDGNYVSHLRFTDVEWSDYFANAVDLVAKRSLMTGYQGTNLFGADNTLNRGQMAIVLYNMAKFGHGIDESSLKYDETKGYKTGFDDVDGNMYYAKAIAWARQAGVVNGYDETHFGPEDNITREEFAAMIMNYEKKFGDYEQADASILDEFSDAASITPWAKNAMSWAVANGVVNGTPEGTLIPTCDIIRADAACMVYNYVK